MAAQTGGSMIDMDPRLAKLLDTGTGIDDK